MILIVGESASGKSTLQKMFIESNPKYKKVVTYTTRPMREGEVNGVDYHFISQSSFDELIKRDFFVEHAKYRGWCYGTAKSDCKGEDVIAVLTPSGMRTLKRLGFDIVSVYLYVDRRSRLISSLVRGDDIDESYRRNLSDVGQFDGVIDEVDYAIDNTGFHMNPNQVLECLKKILKAESATHQITDK